MSIGTRLPTSVEEANIAKKEAETGKRSKDSTSTSNTFIPLWKQEASKYNLHFRMTSNPRADRR